MKRFIFWGAQGVLSRGWGAFGNWAQRKGEPFGEPYSSNLPNCLSADLPISW